MHKRQWIVPLLMGIAFSAQAENTLRVHFIDVGQGDATLIEYDCGAILIDTGGENTSFNSNDALKQYLEDFFMRRSTLGNRLDALILTHPHIDHTRGVWQVIENYTPRSAVTNGRTIGSGRAGQNALRDYALDSQNNSDPNDDVPLEEVHHSEITNGQPLTIPIEHAFPCIGEDPVIRVLWGQVQTQPQPQWWSDDDIDNGNNHSLVVRIDFASASVLLTGDLEEAAIEDLLKLYKGTEWLNVDIYQAGHHGSRNGTTHALINAMSPELAVLSMGPSARQASWTAHAYGHPSDIVAGQLQVAITRTRIPIRVSVGHAGQKFRSTTIDRAVYATGWDGTIVLEADPQGTWSVLNPKSTDRLNVNTATVSELDGLPSIGDSTANAIVDFRTQHGPFPSVDDLLLVSGIGEKTLAKIQLLLRAE